MDIPPKHSYQIVRDIEISTEINRLQNLMEAIDDNTSMFSHEVHYSLIIQQIMSKINSNGGFSVI